MNLNLETAARRALSRFPIAKTASKLAFLDNHGGFSGAYLWQVAADANRWCLKAWPTSNHTAQQLRDIHTLMAVARNSGLEFVPEVAVADDGSTVVEHAGRLWDLTSWMIGRADFHERPTAVRLEAACIALARIHLAWAKTPTVGRTLLSGLYPNSLTGQECPVHGRGPCPAIQRRVDIARQWQAFIASGQQPAFGSGEDPLRAPAERVWQVLRSRTDDVLKELATWTERVFLLQPCLCDIWHDHVLYTGDAVSGIIDFGGVKTDHVAVDLARMLGTMVPDDAKKRELGLLAYMRLRPLTLEEQALVTVLDQTGTLLGAANWLKWAYLEKRHFKDRVATAQRLENLVRRLEAFQPERLEQ